MGLKHAKYPKFEKAALTPKRYEKGCQINH